MKRHGTFHVYILETKQGTYYTGYTTDLKKRVERHNNGHGAKYLKGKLPVRLVYAKKYRYYLPAVREERRIKTLPREKKEQLAREYSDKRRGKKK